MAQPQLIPPRKVTFQEFLELTMGEKAEWVDGEVRIDMSPVTVDHDGIRQFLDTILSQYVQAKNLGTVYGEKFLMHLPEVPSGRSPDVLFLRSERATIQRRSFLDGPVDLAIEIVSKDSRARDRGEKYYEYESAGVGEYWIIDPERQQVEFYVLREGTYGPVQPTDGRYASAVVDGFWIEVDWLWRRPHPSILEVFRAWGML
jgi:Uma2 family endonuclease